MELVMKRPQALPTPTIRDVERTLASGNVGVAIDLAKKILRRDKTQIGAWELLAKAQWQAGRCRELLHTMGRLIRLNPYEPGYFALRAAALQSIGRVGNAIRDYARAGDACPTAQDSITELRDWQSKLISDMLNTDPVFRAHFKQNPEEACKARGFDLLLDAPKEAWVGTKTIKAGLGVRPS